MASATSSHRYPELALATAGSSARESAEVAGSDRAPATSTARDAIDTVIRLADAQASRSDAGSRSVSLGFKFGDEHLSVRVEMRGGEVHTQFVTHSAELRDALASQWSVMTSPGGSTRNQLEFAPAQFSSPSSTDPRGQGGNSGQAREGNEQPASFGSRLRAPSRTAAPAASPSVASSLSSAPAATAAGVLHLNALA